MKKNYLLPAITLILFTINSHAQLNYAFSAFSSVYQPVVGGSTPALINRPFGTGEYSFTYDEGFANAIPIGFTFNYNGVGYTTTNINANGFATLGDPLITDSAFIENYYTNDLTHGNTFGQVANTDGYPYRKGKPILAPLWDDLDLQADLNFRYLTTGSPGSRIFTVEWAQALWQYDAGTATLSFELKLHEGTNLIEFCYHDEGGTPSPAASASIGITDAFNNGTILSLQDVTASPFVGNYENTNISQKPADNQVYRFTPLLYAAPLALRYSAYTSNTVIFTWNAVTGASGYEYAVDNSTTPPVSGTNTAITSATAASLFADAGYYIHVRTAYAGNNFSPWSTIYFRSANDAISLPYTEGFETSSVPALPENSRAQVIDSLNFKPGNDYPGSAYTAPLATYNDGFAATGVNYLQLNANLDAVPTVFYTPGINLSAGVLYNLRFSFEVGYYYPISPDDTGLNHLDALNIRSSNAIGTDSATNTIITLPWRTININSAGGNGYIDTIVSFSPSKTGTYYLGFEFTSGIQKDPTRHTELDFAYASLDDISITASGLPVTLLNFSGEVKDKQNLLHWTTATEENNTGFEVQRSSDGTGFSKIGFIDTKAMNGNSALQLTYNYTDAAFIAGTNYYRLKQIDKDGKFSYSDIVALKDESNILSSIIYPNPVKDILNVKIAQSADEKLAILLTDVAGRQLQDKIIQPANGETIFKFDVSHLPAGTYFLKVISSNGKESKVEKFVKE